MHGILDELTKIGKSSPEVPRPPTGTESESAASPSAPDADRFKQLNLRRPHRLRLSADDVPR